MLPNCDPLDVNMWKNCHRRHIEQNCTVSLDKMYAHIILVMMVALKSVVIFAVFIAYLQFWEQRVRFGNLRLVHVSKKMLKENLFALSSLRNLKMICYRDSQSSLVLSSLTHQDLKTDMFISRTLREGDKLNFLP